MAHFITIYGSNYFKHTSHVASKVPATQWTTSCSSYTGVGEVTIVGIGVDVVDDDDAVDAVVVVVE